jgi:hypothetical protein
MIVGAKCLLVGWDGWWREECKHGCISAADSPACAMLRLDALIADAPDRGKASSVYWGRWLSLNEAKRVRTLLVARLRELGLLPQ